MRNNMKRIWSMALAVLMIFSMAPGAMAAEYYSGSLSLGARVKATAAPTTDPTPAPEASEPEATDEEAEDAEPVESPDPTESTEPAVEETPLPEEEPEVTPEPTFEPRLAIVNKPKDEQVVMVREGPSDDYASVGSAAHGDLMTVYGEENGWMLVEVNGVQGWMSGTFVSYDLSNVEGAEEPEATEEPKVEITEELRITYERDEEGNLILDENGNPIAIVPEGMETPTAYQLDENGALVLDENGDPVLVTEEAVVEEEEEPVRLVLPLLSENETELPMYAGASAESGVLAMIPVGQMVGVLEIGESWSLVTYEGVQGFVLTARIAIYNQEVTEEEEQIVRTISVTSNLEGVAEVEEGTMVVLTATLNGFENTNYTIQWQYSADMGASIVDIPGANDTQYSFPITMENAGYLWRLSVTIHEEAIDKEPAQEVQDSQA